MKTKIKILTVISIMLSICLVYWDTIEIHSGYSNEWVWIDVFGLVALILLGVIVLGSLIASFKNKSYLWCTLPVMFLAVYFFRFYHGPKVLEKSHCDLSTCCSLKIFADGSFHFKESNQNNSVYKSGRVVVKNNTIYLIPGFHLSLNWCHLDKKSVQNTSKIRPVGISFIFEGFFDHQ